MFKCFLLFTITLLAPLHGYSFGFTNWYLRGFLGYNHLSIPSTPEERLETCPGFIIGGAGGYKLSDTFRMEIELDYRKNDLDKLIVTGETVNFQLDVDGTVSKFSYLANAIFDLPVKWPLVPYFGAGLGGYRENGEINTINVNGTIYEANLQKKENGCGYQFIIGVHFVHSEKIDCGIEYHFFDSTKNKGDCDHSVALSFGRIF